MKKSKKIEAPDEELKIPKFLTAYNVPCLYILMRSDLTSLNPGKAMAQASHASNAMVYKAKQLGKRGLGDRLHALFEKWETQTPQGFGTCLVVDADNEMTISEAIRDLSRIPSTGGMLGGLINDPTYPVRDGDITHFISVNTCGYVFCDKGDEAVQEIMSKFPLYK